MSLMGWLGIDKDRARKRELLDKERQHYRHDTNQSLQAIQAGSRLMKSMSGMNRLAREAERVRNEK